FQWFFKVEDLREKIIKNNAKVHWNPDTAKHAYESWITNLKDNSISRQRYWGTPLPIWRCQNCNQIKVVSSRDEIKKNGGKPPQNLHIPWIDHVILKCSCKGMMKRVPDVIDVWVDAGTASWNCLDNNPALLKKWFPADLILEAKEQTRLWFSLLSLCSYLYLGKNAFQNVYVYGMLNDIEGQKMSKSLGNIISPYELINKHGVDVLRYYMCQNNAGQDIKFSWDECKIKERQLHILWNIQKLLINLAHENDSNPFLLKTEKMEKLFSGEEKYIFSKLHSTMNEVTALMETYRVDEIIAPLEELFLHLSRTYIQMVREKSSIGSEKEKQVAMYTIATVLLETLKMFSLISPFICEAIYLNLKEEFGLDNESISHYSWPEPMKGKINLSLEQEMEIVQDIIQSALNAREKAKRGLRWPMPTMIIASSDKAVRNAVVRWQDILISQTNVKTVKAVEQMEGATVEIKPNLGTIGKTHGSLSPQIIAALRQENPQKMIADFEKKGHHTLSIGGKNVRLTPEMIVIHHHLPEGFVDAESKQGVVYLSTEITPVLEAEGYARELMRQVQQLRKDAGLEKTDTINVTIAVSKTVQPQLEQFLKEITEKVGAAAMSFNSTKVLKMKHHGDFMIKNEKIVVEFEKVK
ncbi:MAG: class I tRNA ligase family protein, partial [Nanoarchaeota archaeon]|nr:class I tRNA ligase family protein [Nanoarchaeota archaeon]